ncbi:mating-type protein ALPHA1 [Monosporozyma unispora]
MNSKRIIFRATVPKKKYDRHLKKCSRLSILSFYSFDQKELTRLHLPNDKILAQLKFNRGINKPFKNPAQIIAAGKLNSFFAFRTYYSQFSQGINQNSLSTILADEWKKDKQEQELWALMTEQYKQIKDI